MSNALNDMFRKVIVLGSALIGAVAVIGSGLGYLVAGIDGLISALIGSALTLAFVTVTALSVWSGSKLPLAGFFGLVMGGWLVKLIGFMFLIGALRDADFINGPVLFFTMVAAILGSLAVDSVVALKARIPVLAA